MLYVSNDALDRITRISQPERTSIIWGESGTQAGQFDTPIGIALDGENLLYVTDSRNNRLQVFDASGKFLRQWGEAGTGSGQFNAPSDVVWDGGGSVYVMDSGNNRVQRFALDGTPLLTWGTSGSGSGQFNCDNPGGCGLAIDSSGLVYVADTVNNRIQRFTADGQYLGQWGTEGVGQGQFREPKDLAFDSSGNSYVVDTQNCRIQKFSPASIVLLTWGSCGSATDEFRDPTRIAIDAVGAVYVADSGNARVLKFDNTGKYLRQWGQDGEPERALGYNYVTDLVTNGNNRIYALDVTASRILSFDPFGNFVTTWPSPSINQRTLIGAENLAVDPSGSVYLAETYSQTIWRFDGAGQLQSLIAAQYPQHISADADGNVYGAELRHFQLVKYNSGGVLNFSTFITHSVSSTAVNPDGGIYVSTGVEIKTYSTDGVLEGTFAAIPAHDLAMAPTGTLFAVSGNSVVQFDHAGAVVAQIQSEDYHANFFRVAAGSDDWLYVLDFTGRRVYAFAPGLPVPDPISGAIQNGDFSAEPALAYWRRGGTLAVARQTGVLGADGPNLRLAAPVAQVSQGEGSAWAHQTVYVEPSWTRPTLSFAYDVHTNDLRDYSDFYVEIQDAYGTSQLASVMREGYRSCAGAMPPAGTDLQWQTRVLDLSSWKGQWIRVVFWARNLWPDSLGLWADVDSVRVFDAGPAPAYAIFLPVVTRSAAGSLCQ